MAIISSDLFEALFGLQRALDELRASSWLGSSLSGGATYPPINVFRKGDDFPIITDVPGIKKSDLEVQVRGNAARVAGTKAIDYPDKASLHRRKRVAGASTARSIPVEIAPDRVKAEFRDGIPRLVSHLRRTGQAEVDDNHLSRPAHGGCHGEITRAEGSGEEGTCWQGREDDPSEVLRSQH